MTNTKQQNASRLSTSIYKRVTQSPKPHQKIQRRCTHNMDIDSAVSTPEQETTVTTTTPPLLTNNRDEETQTLDDGKVENVITPPPLTADDTCAKQAYHRKINGNGADIGHVSSADDEQRSDDCSQESNVVETKKNKAKRRLFD